MTDIIFPAKITLHEANKKSDRDKDGIACEKQ
ncbi:excalibur calcium-binding domain-containing protein [Paenibacillus thermotolerans]